MAWAQRDPKDHPAPNSLPFHQTRLLHALSTLGLEHLQDVLPSSQPSFLVVKGAKLLNQSKLVQSLFHTKPATASALTVAALPGTGQHQGALFSDCPPTPHLCTKLLLHLPSLPDLMAMPENKKNSLFFLPNPSPETVTGRSRYPEQRWEPLIPTASAQL